MKHMKSTFIIILIFCIVLFNGACFTSKEASTKIFGTVTEHRITSQQTLAKNAPAPDFQMQMPDGSIRFLSDLRDNVVLLNFWSVSCPYCVVQMPYLQTAYDQLSAQEVVILGINVGESEQTVVEFIKEKGISYPIILDSDIYASILYGVQYIPITYYIDKTGNIQGVKIGPFQDANEVVAVIEELLQ